MSIFVPGASGFRAIQRALGCGLMLTLAFCGGHGLAGAAAPQPHPLLAPVESIQAGVRVSFSSQEGTRTDTIVRPNVRLYVPAGEAPTPFLASGPFEAVWDGWVSVEMRGEYAFQAELNGELKLAINGREVLAGRGVGGWTEPGRPIRLNKGTNSLVATFKSPTAGDAMLRLHWIPRNARVWPVPDKSLSHTVSESEAKAVEVRLGQELFAEHRCAKCHTGGASGNSMLELGMDAPALDGIGARRNPGWMAQWLLDPKSLRPDASMPRLFHGPAAHEEARAVAAFLGSENSEVPASTVPAEPSLDLAAAGQALFGTLQCAACHNAPDALKSDATLISLEPVRQKFAPGALAAFLKKPEEQYAWIRMPNFRLSDDEARQLAAYLNSPDAPPPGPPGPPDVALLERGRELVRNSGCLNCHSSSLRNEFATLPLIELAPARWDRGCMDSSGQADAPQFNFSPSEAAALRAFAATDRAALERHAPVEFAGRQIRRLNCAACHGRIEGSPPLDVLGGKLKPEWAAQFLAGEVREKPRPWLPSRMPAFASRAAALAHGMALEHGYPAKTPAEPSIDEAALEIGARLISAEGGFACIGCHGVADVAPTQVFESAGINLAYSSERLLQPFFERWILNPLAIDPTTRMPVYFDEENRSPLSGILEGDGLQQIRAMWEYVRLGDKMPPPPGTRPGAPATSHNLEGLE